VGALSGRCLLTARMAQWTSLADVEQFRLLPERYAAARRVDLPTLVLGSTQSADVLSAPAVRTWSGEVVRRRGGGGAVLLLPGDHLWLDSWIPRSDPLWEADVSGAAGWVGQWWCSALAAVGVGDCHVHHGKALLGRHPSVCFSGRGPGEVFHHGKKVVGVSQWRSREGALFHSCAYARWDPEPLVALLDLDERTRSEWRAQLGSSAVGIEELSPSGTITATLTERLVDSFPRWGAT